MTKKIIAILLATLTVLSTFNMGVLAAKEDDETVAEVIKEVKNRYEPAKTYFVSDSDKLFVGEDNVNGDSNQACFAPGTNNSHGRFGGLWQSHGFARYVYNEVFGDIPMYDYHCNPSSLSKNIEVVGRYASKCRLLRGSVDGVVTEENVKALLSEAKVGDILVMAPKLCSITATSLVITGVNNAGVTAYQADFTGSCAVTESTIPYDAIASYHCVTLLRSTDYPTVPEVAPKKTSDISLSADNLALNENVSVTWSAVKWADSYKVSLVKCHTDEVVCEEYVKDTVASFKFDVYGEYQVVINAVNEYGEGDGAYSEIITVHNVVNVTFADYDGTVISKQKVQYGGNATPPSSPERKGYKFSGWDRSLENITESTEIYATYEIEKYRVLFYDIGGNSLLKEERVPYGESATPPDDYSLSDGYVFAGWHVDFDDIYQCADFTNVTGDMKLVATECWENDNLPILITINSAVLNKDGKTYTIDALLKNYDKADTSFKIVVTLKTSIGKTVKSIPYKEITLEPGEEEAFVEEIVYSDKISSVELVAVGVKDEVRTTGAYSVLASSPVTALADWHWGEWTDYTEENKTGEYDDYEAKTEYRQRTKAYTTSNSSNVLEGWTLYDTQAKTGNWTSWQNGAVSAVNTLSLKREVQTKTVPATYKTQYRYGRWKKTTGTAWYHFCYDLGRSQQGGTWAKQYTAWSDTARTRTKTNKWVCSSNHSSHIGNNGKYWHEYSGGYYWQETRQVQLTAAYTQYSYRDTTYTYHFSKWNDWSSWQDAPIEETSDIDVEERTVFRYRNKITDSVSNPDAGVEDNSGNEYSFAGTIPETTADLSGKLANLMVYKKTNSDPTEAQLEYVGQITIGEENTYDITFRPREEPTEDTGDFIVTLGVEGADNLVNIEVIPADLPTHTVRFFDEDGTELCEAQEIPVGGAAIVPDAPEKEGYTFVKWSENTTNIRSNTEIQAVYQKNQYTVTFIDRQTGEVTSEKLYYGDYISYPVLEKMQGITNRYWDKQKEEIEIVTDNMIIQTVAEYEAFFVNFRYNDELIAAEIVAYGDKVQVPDIIPEQEGMVFADWVGECSYNYVTCDAEFVPSFIYGNTVSAPVAESTDNGNGTKSVTLSCETEGATILYMIEDANAVHLFEVDEDYMTDNAIDVLTGIYGSSGSGNGSTDTDTDTGDDSSIPTGGMPSTETLPSIGVGGGIGGPIFVPGDLGTTEENVFGQSGGYTFLGVSQVYNGETITLSEGQTLVYLAMAANMNDSIPVTEEMEKETYYTAEISENTLRQYKASVEGSLAVEIDNKTAAFDIGTFTLCFYDERGVLIDLFPCEITLAPGINTVEFNDIVVSTKADSVSCKLMSWMSGDDDVKPISDVVDVEVR